MNAQRTFLRLPALIMSFALATIAVHGTIFTTNTAIGALNTNYEGADVVVTNCTVTVDGAHSFASVQINAGGVLTHSEFAFGINTLVLSVTNEPQVLGGAGPVTLAHTNISLPVVVTDLGEDITYTNGVDYVTVPLTNGLTELEWTNTSSITNGQTVLVSYSWTDSVKAGLNLTVAGNVEVAPGGRIDASGDGYAAGYGLGPGVIYAGYYGDGSGGGYGGAGGYSMSNAVGGVGYGSVPQPTDLGSGGGNSYAGPGGFGGGAVQIVAGGTINIDGELLANGEKATNSRSGGGAGGSIWLEATNLSGGGVIAANGGAGEPPRGGGGGGGRVSIQCGASSFAGSLTATGGSGWEVGGAGTIFTQVAGQKSLLLVDNGGQVGTNSSVALPAGSDVLIRGQAVVVLAGPWSAGNLTIATNSTLLATAQTIMNLTVTGALDVQAGGQITADGLGYTAGSGVGAGHAYQDGVNNPCSGGGFGGSGAFPSPPNVAGGMASGTATTPPIPGSGGGGVYVSSAGGTYSTGGNGGGALQISVAGALQLDGRISAGGGNGTGTGGGGGSGGSVNIHATSVAGGGSIAANGGSGAGTVGGGGGGGRIAIYVTTNNFAGSISAAGGGGANWGGAGTVYEQQSSPAATLLIVDNAGHNGTNTPLQAIPPASLALRNGATGTASASLTFASLMIGSNAWLEPPAPQYVSQFAIAINGNATIQSGGGITASSSSGNSSPGGYSQGYPYGCGGGGHGGAGGNSSGNQALGGVTGESSPTQPTAAGGLGGTVVPYSIGGLGGGVIQLVVSGTLQLDGVVSVNGGNGGGTGGGGGAGGSINLSASTLAGAGSITANGGNGVNVTGGGGGGGCIATVFTKNLFAGAFTAYGGAGSSYGGAGTIYLKTNSLSHGTLLVDNDGHAGANSLTASSSTVDLTLQNGGIVYAVNSLVLGNLWINSNAWLVVSNAASQASPTTLNLTVYGNASLQAGGGISADTTGYHGGQGSGAGGYYGSSPYYPGGGGGHGGFGASAFTNAYLTGGNAGYDVYSGPTIAGSGGGGNPSYSSTGGNGGGVIQMTVNGTLELNGSLSANGGNGTGGGGGGGAGGSLNLNFGGLTGTGVLAANGGNGVAAIGGGGGGGIIALTCGSNLFAGTLSAFGGAGAGYGGAGLIFLQTNYASGSATALVMDNAGHRGTNTPLPSLSSNVGLVLRNGALGVPTYPGQTVSSLLITSNAWLIGGPGNNPGTVSLSISGKATIQSGGGIVTDAEGSGPNSGTGRGGSAGTTPWYQCSGAGHGGYGALSLSNSAAGGNTYDSTTSPNLPGSSGGGYSGYSTGGAGGGYVLLYVNGALQLDGAISANGGNGAGAGGGGGSGGTISLNLGSLAGAGGITANGGSGALTYGGGGGGGCIALTFGSNAFAGVISAYGGGGANFGGAGTIYTKTNGQPYGLLLLDNAGNAGTNTPLNVSTMDVTIQNKAVGYLSTSGAWSPHNLWVRTNGWLMAAVSPTQRAFFANAVTIDSGGVFSLDGCGFSSQMGSGAGYSGSTLRGGGSHGGYGGGDPYDSSVYDSIQTPTSAGSGGATYYVGGTPAYGGYGGGALELQATAITVNGRLSANGLGGGASAGGGAGGSLYFPRITTLAGSGVISANGAAATGAAGGGGGGRLAIFCTSNAFSGQLSASGGNGLYPGGAGTIYTRVGGASSLIVDNGGLPGTNTPYSSSYGPPNAPFNLTISGGALLVPYTTLPLLSNLTIGAGSTLTVPSPRTLLSLAVLSNFNLAGSVVLDGEGYAQLSGQGPGKTVSNEGSGGGYGGQGGDSAEGVAGGTNYGSATQPVDFGSGGGAGLATIPGGSDGGGAVRVSVGGTLTVNGDLSANGNYGWQDNSGGGAGGSIWIAANTLAGAGNMAATGGNGSLYGGGGGGGGRIAIYAPNNEYTGTTNVSGGNGANSGQAGTLFLSSALNSFQVNSQTPTGEVDGTVSAVTLTFSDAVAPASLSAAAITITTPAGTLPSSSISLSASCLYAVQVSFPTQNLVGNYSVQVTPSFTSILGQPLASAYTGGFSIVLPTLSGTVVDTNGAPVAGVLLQPNGGLTGVSTDTNGNYSVGVPAGWTGTLTPSLGAWVFVPSSLSYTNLNGSLTGQNFLMVPTAAPNLATSLSGTNLVMTWPGIPGVTYQPMWSTNLVDWQLLGGALNGSNGVMQLSVPLSAAPQEFFELEVGY